MATAGLRHRAGFSFVELLVVMVLLGIMAGLAVPRFRDMKRRGYETTLISDLRHLANVQEQHWADAFMYSDDFEALRYGHSDQVVVRVIEFSVYGWSAIAEHQDVAIRCAVFHGDAAPVAPATQSAKIACT